LEEIGQQKQSQRTSRTTVVPRPKRAGKPVE
jgi:hypothetical protein